MLKELAPIEREITTNQNANSVHDATLKLLLLLAQRLAAERLDYLMSCEIVNVGIKGHRRGGRFSFSFCV